MDQAAQTTLRYQYIMEKTALAQGDYAKPIDSYAVSSRNLTNALQEMQGKMATSLIPTLIKGADFFTDLFRKAGNWADENRPKIEAFLGNAIKFIQKAAKTIAPIALAIAGGIKSIMANLQPVIGRTKDWIAANRELIQTRVQGFVKIISLVIEKMVPLISSVLGIFIRIIPVVATFITSLWGIKTVIGGVSAAIGVISVAVHKVGLAMRIVRLAARSVGAAMRVLHVNPITLIIIAVAALITGFMVLASKVGGVGNAFTVLGQILMKVMLTPLNLVVDCIQALVSLAGTVVPTIGSAFTMAGQTIMKAMLTPINLVIDGIKGLLTVVSKIPGVGGKVEGALSAVATFQDAMNTRLTGSASTLSSDGLSAFVDPARAWAAGGFGQAEREAGMARADGINSRIQAAQEEMNIAHTGSASTLFESGPEAFLDPYKNARAAELERQETARQAAVQEDNSEIVERLDAIARNTGATTSAVEGLGEGNAQGVPGRLNYAQMGQENWWEMARAGL
jgi:hypothetical protein